MLTLTRLRSQVIGSHEVCDANYCSVNALNRKTFLTVRLQSGARSREVLIPTKLEHLAFSSVRVKLTYQTL
jgi:hypothetical protein